MIQSIRENCPDTHYFEAKGPVNSNDPRVSFVAEYLMGQVSIRLEQVTPGENPPWPDPETAVVQLTFDYVRNKVKDSAPEDTGRLTWKASEVLSEHEGTCYGKANLLAALLRKNGIPTGFAYQYRRDAHSGQLVLHALNAVYLESLGGWLRLDASCDNPVAGASPLTTSLADMDTADLEAHVCPIHPEQGEDNLPIIYAEPDPQLERLVCRSASLADFWAKRPDRLTSAEHDHDAEPAKGWNSEHDDQLLDMLYGDPDDEDFDGGCSHGSCSSCSHGGCSH
jgi:hypothetical protein